MSAYFIVNCTITDAALLDEYVKAAGSTLGAHKIKPLVVTNSATVVEGQAGERVVVLEFADRAAVDAWYNSPEYQAILGKRLDATKGFAVVVDGLG